MKLIWKGKWRKGEITIEAETFQELDKALRELSASGEIQELSGVGKQGVPEITSARGCLDAIRALMETDWGKHPKSMNEIKGALEANALYFSKGTLSGTLTTMIKRGVLQRVKKDGRWRYLSR